MENEKATRVIVCWRYILCTFMKVTHHSYLQNRGCQGAVTITGSQLCNCLSRVSVPSLQSQDNQGGFQEEVRRSALYEGM